MNNLQYSIENQNDTLHHLEYILQIQELLVVLFNINNSKKMAIIILRKLFILDQ